MGSCYSKRALAQPVVFLHLLIRCACHDDFDNIEILKFTIGEESLSSRTRPTRPYTSFLSATPERLIRWSERLLRCSLHLLRCSVRLLRCCGRCRSEVRPRSELATCYVLPTGEGKRRLRLRQVRLRRRIPGSWARTSDLAPRTSAPCAAGRACS